MQPRHCKDTYALAKIAAEIFLKSFAADEGLSAAILQPTMIYGPFSKEWTLSPLAMLRSSNVAMPDGNTSMCNAVYADDVVSAALLAIGRCAPSCPSYLINGDDLPSWADFLARHASLGTTGKVVRLPVDEMERLRKQGDTNRSLVRTGMRILREQPAVRSAVVSTTIVSKSFRLLQKVCSPRAFDSLKGKLSGKGAQEPPVVRFPAAPPLPTKLPPPHFLELAAQSHRYSISKASAELGYTPEYSLDRAFEIIGAWAQWSRLVR
jgi:nucleoside-diphosphate-sugar epimerase